MAGKLTRKNNRHGNNDKSKNTLNLNNLNLRLASLTLNNNNNKPRKIKFNNRASEREFNYNSLTGNLKESKAVTLRKNGPGTGVRRIPVGNVRSRDPNNVPLALRVRRAHANLAAGIDVPRALSAQTDANLANRRNLRKLASMAYSSNNSKAVAEIKNAYRTRTNRNAKLARNLAIQNEANAKAVNTNDTSNL